MNHYNIHFTIQGFITIVAAALALTIQGLIMVAFIQAFMGIYQTITALFVFSFYKQYPTAIKKHLNIYALVWLVNAILTLLLFSGINDRDIGSTFETIGIILFFLIPWSSAIYFITILKKLADWKTETNNSDKEIISLI